MIWSFSSYRTFRQCQRKWFFSQKMANATTKDPIRKEAFYLSQLKSLAAWRGSLVDKVLEKVVAPSLSRGTIPSISALTDYAEKLTDSQLEFARKKSYRDENMTKTKAGDNYAALFDIEYNGSINNTELSQAKEEIEKSLNNLLVNEKLLNKLLACPRLIAQKSIIVNFDNFNARATPDLIAVFRGKPPIIVDWKVSVSRTSDYWLQLVFYAMALYMTSINKGWLTGSVGSMSEIKDAELFEVNLLTNSIKKHYIEEGNIEEVEDLIYETAREIQLIENSLKYEKLDINRFSTTHNPNNCWRCSFKKICWEMI